MKNHYLRALINRQKMIVLSLVFTHIFELYPEVYIYPLVQ